jgi:hypothetical protein
MGTQRLFKRQFHAHHPTVYANSNLNRQREHDHEWAKCDAELAVVERHFGDHHGDGGFQRADGIHEFAGLGQRE